MVLPRTDPFGKTAPDDDPIVGAEANLLIIHLSISWFSGGVITRPRTVGVA